MHIYNIMYIYVRFVAPYIGQTFICMFLLTCSPGTGGGGGDLEPSSMGRFCWYLLQFVNVPLQQ